jgi:hypothetical protein
MCQYEVIHLVDTTRLVDEMSQGTGIRSLSEPVVLPRPRTIGTSPGSLSWLRESPATPVLAAHGPGNHGGVAGGPVHQISLVPRKLVFSYVRALPVTSRKAAPLLATPIGFKSGISPKEV